MNPPYIAYFLSRCYSLRPPIEVTKSHIFPTPSFATPLRRTPAPTGLRNTAQGCRALASAPLGIATPCREANPPLHCTQLPPAASAKRPAPHLPARSLRKLTPSYATPLRRTPAPKGLRSTAQGQPSLSEATLGYAPLIREANPPLLHTQQVPAASAIRPATHLPTCRQLTAL